MLAPFGPPTIKSLATALSAFLLAHRRREAKAQPFTHP